jgi:hypothetical protein
MSFAALPPVPTSGLTDAEFQLLAAIHQNIGILTGQVSSGYKAVIPAQLTLAFAPDGEASAVSLTGSANDLATLAGTLQVLINDVQSLRDTVNILIAQLRS